MAFSARTRPDEINIIGALIILQSSEGKLLWLSCWTIHHVIQHFFGRPARKKLEAFRGWEGAQNHLGRFRDVVISIKRPRHANNMSDRFCKRQECDKSDFWTTS